MISPLYFLIKLLIFTTKENCHKETFYCGKGLYLNERYCRIAQYYKKVKRLPDYQLILNKVSQKFPFTPLSNKEKTKLDSFLSQGVSPKGKHAFRTIARLIRSFFKKIPKGFRRKILDSWCYPMCRDHRERLRGERQRQPRDYPKQERAQRSDILDNVTHI